MKGRGGGMEGPLQRCKPPSPLRRVMNSDACRKPPLGTFKSISNPINSGAGKRMEAYGFTASICLLRMSRALRVAKIAQYGLKMGSFHLLAHPK